MYGQWLLAIFMAHLVVLIILAMIHCTCGWSNWYGEMVCGPWLLVAGGTNHQAVGNLVVARGTVAKALLSPVLCPRITQPW